MSAPGKPTDAKGPKDYEVGFRVRPETSGRIA